MRTRILIVASLMAFFLSLNAQNAQDETVNGNLTVSGNVSATMFAENGLKTFSYKCHQINLTGLSSNSFYPVSIQGDVYGKNTSSISKWVLRIIVHPIICTQ